MMDKQVGARDRQQGITLWGIIAIALLTVFFMLLAFKLIPPYVSDAKVGSILNRVANLPDARQMTPDELTINIEKRFDIENIDHLDPRKDLEIYPQGAIKILEIEYEVVVSLAFNISALLVFEHKVEVR